ncbi:hypothetical protein H257_17201 [Aphanomyces astaci]|uniref:Uncharacterized protein n=1 Tax=Aphanomyces astaci TaxID=112090 RepID=W4FHS4_APHAT|nr:hypothetical protein H257_17201 [Aphanomyces astaci]ETV66298.1 hypothetical protein H257_17201 [Aphanomyces astaci]|eukprot:XP_009844204.1 hypothetical protein H257_17201 [Aphanomyces astaci]
MASKRHSHHANIGGQGQKELIPFGPALFEFMRMHRDEERYTAVYFDMPMGKTLAEVGKSSKVVTCEKHLDRLAAVLTIRADEESHDKEVEAMFSFVEPLPHAMLKTEWLVEEDNRVGNEDFTGEEKRLAMVKRTILNHGEHSTPNATKRTYKRIPLSAKKRIVDAFNNAMDWKRVAQAKGVNISSARNWLHLDSLTSKQRGGNKYHDS